MRFTIQIAIDALSLGSFYAIVALGIALIFGVMQLINLAHGELIMVGAYTIVWFGAGAWPILVLGPIVAGAIMAVLMERVAFRPVRGATIETLLVTSFAVSFLLQNTAILTQGALPKPVTLPPVVSESFRVGDLRIAKLNVITIIAATVLVGALALFLKRSELGIQMRAAAADFEMARLLGVRANTVIALSFAIGGMLAGAVAFLFVAQVGVVTPRLGLNLVIIGFVSMIIGGIGSLPGAAIGGFMLGIMTTVLQAYLPRDIRPYRDAFVFGLVIALLLLRPRGILGKRYERTAG